MFRTAEPDTVGSAMLVAVTVTDAGFGTVGGAVYRPFASIDPPFTVQVTELFINPDTAAVIWRVPLTTTDSLFGVTVIVPAPAASTGRKSGTHARNHSTPDFMGLLLRFASRHLQLQKLCGLR